MCDQDNISPLSQCATQLEISNVGDDDSSALTYQIVAWADEDGVDSGAVGPGDDSLVPCFNVNLLLGVADGLNVGNNSSDGPLAGSELGVGDSEFWGIEASVDGDNACQGATTTLIVAVTAVGDEDDDDPDATPVRPTRTPTSVTDNGDSSSPGGPGTTGFATPTPTLTTRTTSIPTAPNQPPSTGQTAPVNTIVGVQRLPSTGSGGLLGSSGFQPGAFEAAAMVLLLGVILAGFSFIRRTGRLPVRSSLTERPC